MIPDGSRRSVMADGNEYEEQRLKRIAQNQATLLALGLHANVSAVIVSRKPVTATIRVRAKPLADRSAAGGQRRSARLKGETASTAGTAREIRGKRLDDVPLVKRVKNERHAVTDDDTQALEAARLLALNRHR